MSNNRVSAAADDSPRSKLKIFLSKVASTGLDESIAPRDVRYIKACNAAVFILVVLNFGYALPIAIVARRSPVPLILVNTVLPLVHYWLAGTKRFNAARIFFISNVLIVIIGNGALSQEIATINSILGIIVTYAIFPDRHKILRRTISSLFLIVYLIFLFDITATSMSPNKWELVLILALFGFLILYITHYGAGEVTRTENALDRERARSEKLLLNVLPEQIAGRLKNGETRIADRLDEVTILFADIVQFHRICE